MADLGRLSSQLTIHEGYRLRPYRDSKGKITVGVGRNLSDRGVKPDEISLMLRNDIADALRECRQYGWFNGLDDVRQNVILNMVFNMGMPRLLGFKVTIGHIAAGRFAEASEEMLDSDWARRDVSEDRSGELSRMMKSGKWPG